MEKQDLLELFYKVALPLPQRKYRQNRRGKMMTKLQNIMAKRKRTYNEANYTVGESKNFLDRVKSRYEVLSKVSL